MGPIKKEAVNAQEPANCGASDTRQVGRSLTGAKVHLIWQLEVWGVVLLENNAKQILLTLPPYTPTLLALTDPELTILVIRVDSLQPFEQEDLRLEVSFAGYEHGGTYLACVAFRIFDNPDDPLLGDAYLNPRQAIERKALQNLTLQQQLPFIFLSRDLTAEVVKYVSWQERCRAYAREVLTASAGFGLIEGSFDPEYQRVKQRFQAAYSVKSLLS